MTRWPIGSVTLENRHLYTREQLHEAGVVVPELDRVDPRVMHHVEDALRKAAEGIQHGRLVVDDIYTNGSEITVCRGGIDGDRADRDLYEMLVSALRREVREELGA